jgi:hypothetical protein
MKLDDLNPDGLRVTINWEGMDVGSSFFLPCINTEKGMKQLNSVAKMKACMKQLNSVAKMKAWEFDMQICIENKKLGLRVWRTV